MNTYLLYSTFESLLNVKSGHIKENSISYTKFKIQPYLESSSLSHNERSKLFNLRAETVNGFKGCFSSAFEDNHCRL